jgi:hypothetical protein
MKQVFLIGRANFLQHRSMCSQNFGIENQTLSVFGNSLSKQAVA